VRLKNTLSDRQKDGVKGAVLTVVVGLCFLVFPIGERLKNLSYELPFLFRPDIRAKEVVIIYMDEASHRLLKPLGAAYDKSWNRTIHAALLQRLKAWGVKAVVFDILFDEPTDSEQDAQFIRAIRDHGLVVLAARVTPEKTFQGGPVVWTIAQPFAQLQEVASWGVVERALAQDPSVRRHYLGASGEPSLAWRTAAVTMTNPPPQDPTRTRWVNYYGPPFALTNYSYHQVLESNALPNAAAMFSNKVVFVGSHIDIGYSAGRPTEYFRTPYSLWTKALAPGVEINATTYLNLLRRDWLTEMPIAVELLLLTVCGLGLGYGLAGCRSWAAAGLGLGVFLMVGLGAVVLVWRAHVWFPWLLVGGVEVPCAFAWAVLTSSRRVLLEQEILEEKLAIAKGLTTSSFPPVQSGRTTPLPRAAKLYAPAPASSAPASVTPGALGSAGQAPPPIPDHTLVRCIGQGAYGQVWLARDAIGTYHAVKVIYQSTFKDFVPFEREFRGIQKFTPISRSHPGFVHILHVGRNDEAGYFYYIMELGDDERSGQQIDPNSYSPKNLARELSRRGRLTAAECVDLSLDLTAALDHLHQHQLIHRDVKPSNIIFVSNLPKFADIGLVTDVAETGRDVSYLGTEGFMAPEGPGTPAADVYSLGKVIYEASTGLSRARFPELPTFLGEGIDFKLLGKLNKIVLKACQPDPRYRYASAAAMREDLLRLRRQKSRGDRSWSWTWRHKEKATPNPP
jgi:CHASE2 domain-containing sensor protein